ncbi:MAG: SsgA family sporulation/cell division regulator [Actinomycetota bacterium]|nr:SsgA family sporulation/cell division regulator [Actinomycetota bacterium]
MSDDTVVQDMFAVLHGQAAPVVTRWTYLAEDPYAVTLSIHTRGDRWVEWVMARDLLVAGFIGSAGIGDVLVRPDCVHGYDVIVVEISSPDGYAVLELDQALLDHFVQSSREVVPLGHESAAVDMAAEIERFARSCAE